MCSRYYINDETAREITKLLCELNAKGNETSAISEMLETSKIPGQSARPSDAFPASFAGDISPTKPAPVLFWQNGSFICKIQQWGLLRYPDFGKRVIFNARSESVLIKPFFQESIKQRRAVIPAAWFYEWNSNKEKNTFYRKDTPALYFAGCFSPYPDGNRFVILTTKANASMQPVHDRMPLILEKGEIVDWILDHKKTEQFLAKTPCLLECRTDYEQMTLDLTSNCN